MAPEPMAVFQMESAEKGSSQRSRHGGAALERTKDATNANSLHVSLQLEAIFSAYF